MKKVTIDNQSLGEKLPFSPLIFDLVPMPQVHSKLSGTNVEIPLA